MSEPSPKKQKINDGDTLPSIVHAISAEDAQEEEASRQASRSGGNENEGHSFQQLLDGLGCKDVDELVESFKETSRQLAQVPLLTARLDNITARLDNTTATRQASRSGGNEKEGHSFQALFEAFGCKDADELVAYFNDKFNATNKQVSLLTARLDNFTGAFEPATVSALMETAVYNSIDDSLDDAVKFGVSSTCSLLLEVFAKNDPALLRDAHNKGNFKKWNGPGGSRFDMKDRLPVFVQGIHGLLAFVDKANQSEIAGWSPEDRNGLSHNGGFLDSIYKNPEKATSVDHTAYTAVKKDVKEKMAHYSAEGKKVDSLISLQSLGKPDLEKKLKAKLGAVAAAVRGKGVTVDPTLLDQVEKFLASLGN